MLGSIHDADDMVQETWIRAWKGYRRFENRSSVRHWLYRIATNRCLNALTRRANRQRLLPQALQGSTHRMPEGKPATDVSWLEPYPDTMLANAMDDAPGPDARYAQRDSVRLAFVAAIQHLPAKQRAVLLLRDVLGWSAQETAGALKLSVASVTSALQRARETLAARFPEGLPERASKPDRTEGHLIERYVAAWESSDLRRLVHLLQEEATLAMPPWTQWYQGRAAIKRFFGWAFDWAWKSRKRETFRMMKTSANGQIALALYFRGRGETEFHAHTLQLLTVSGRLITELVFFVGPKSFEAFGLPMMFGGAGREEAKQRTKRPAPSLRVRSARSNPAGSPRRVLRASRDSWWGGRA